MERDEANREWARSARVLPAAELKPLTVELVRFSRDTHAPCE